MIRLTKMTRRMINQETERNRELQEPCLSLNCPPWSLRSPVACLKAGFFYSKKILMGLFVHTSNSSLEFSSLALAVMETCQQNRTHKANRKYTKKIFFEEVHKQIMRNQVTESISHFIHLFLLPGGSKRFIFPLARSAVIK